MEGRDYTVEAADGVKIALHRLLPARPARRAPVLLVPGTFSTRTFWLGTSGQGFATTLARHGFDTWVLELRGHGASERPARWRLRDWIERDAPAAVQRVLEESAAPGVVWVGHSAGGVVGAAFSGTPHPGAQRLLGLVLLGSPGPGGLTGVRRGIARALHLATGLWPGGSVPGPLVGLGPEREPNPLIREWMGWNLAGAWWSPRGEDYLASLSAVTAPVLAVAGAGDSLLAPPAAVEDLLRRFGSPDRRLLVAGLETGYGRDYDHAGLMIGRTARQEIWPELIRWLERRAASPVEESVTGEPS